MNKLTKAILVLSLAFASGKCLGDWTDAGWDVGYLIDKLLHKIDTERRLQGRNNKRKIGSLFSRNSRQE